MSIGVEKINLVDPNNENIIGGKSKNPYRVKIKGDKKIDFEAEYFKETPKKTTGNTKWVVKPSKEYPITKSDKSVHIGDKIGVRIPAKYCGPKAHLMEAYTDTPTSKYPNMVIIYGEAPYRILTTSWSKTRGGDDTRQTPIKFGDAVWLNVTTEGLNEAIVNVSVYNRELGDDEIIYTYTNIKCYNGQINLNILNTFIWRSSIPWIKRNSIEDFYIKIRLKGKKEFLIDYNNDDKHAIYLKVKNEISNKTFKQSEFNLPLKTGNLEVDIERYEPCSYKTLDIEAVVGKDSKKQDIIRKATVYENNKKVKPFQIVAGSGKAKKQVTVNIGNLKTNPDVVCLNSSGHKENVFRIDEKPISSYSAAKKSSSTEPKSPWGGKVNVGLEANKTKLGQNLGFDNKDIEIISSTGEKLELKVPYPYNYAPLQAGPALVLHPAFRYFWPKSDRLKKTHNVLVQTCQQQHRIPLEVYPDIKWTFGLEFAYTTTNKTFYDATPKVTKKSKYHQSKKKFTTIKDRKIGWSLDAQWNDDKKLELTGEFEKSITEATSKLGKGADFIKNAFLGKENKDDKKYKTPRAKEVKTLESLKKRFQKAKSAGNTRDRDIKNAATGLRATTDLKRSVVGLDIIYPKLAAQFSWSLEGAFSEHENANQIGTKLEGELIAKPLFGLSAYLDFFALAQKMHPIAMAVIAIADLSLELIGDGSSMTCELRATGKIGLSLKGFLNTLTGENSFNKLNPENSDNDGISLTGELKIALTLDIVIKKEKNYSFIGVKVVGELAAGASAEAKWSAGARLSHDLAGFYIQPSCQFEGLELKAHAKATALIKDIDDDTDATDDDNSFGGSVGGEVTYQAIDKQPKKELDKIYFKK